MKKRCIRFLPTHPACCCAGMDWRIYQSSVLKEETGNPSVLNNSPTIKSLNACRTATGFACKHLFVASVELKRIWNKKVLS